MSYEWINQQILHMRFSGVVKGEEMIRASLDIAGESRFDYTHFLLGDWTQAEQSIVDHDDVKTLVAIMKSTCQICPHVKNATVIPPDRTGNALTAFYKMLADDLPWEIEIFHDFKEAFSWFGLPLPASLAQTC